MTTLGSRELLIADLATMTLRSVLSVSGMVVGARVGNDGAVNLVHSNGTLSSVSRDGVERRLGKAELGVIVGGLRSGEHWVVQVQASAAPDSFFVATIDKTGKLLARSSSFSGLHLLASANDGMLLAKGTSPFTIARLLREESVVRADSIDALSESELPPERGWRSAALAAWQGGHLLTLADPRGSGRLLRLRTSPRAEARSRRLDAPIGFITADPAGTRLVAYRRTRGPELVVYVREREDVATRGSRTIHREGGRSLAACAASGE